MRRRVGSAKAAKTDDNCFRLLTTGSDLYSSQPAGVNIYLTPLLNIPERRRKGYSMSLKVDENLSFRKDCQ